MSTLFDTEVQLDPAKDYTPDLVGEGKKFKDVAALAYGKLNSDIHASKLEKELKELREDLAKRVTLEEVMTKLSQNKQVEPNGDNQDRNVNPAQTLTKEQLAALVDEQVAKKLNETDAERSARTNFDTVVGKLKEAWGESFQAKLEAKRQELGLGKEWMTQLAGSQPKAFLSLVGVAAPAAQGAVSPFDIGSINTTALSSGRKSGEKTMSYYQEMRKSDPTKYHSRATQIEIHDQAIKLGQAFFDV